MSVNIPKKPARTAAPDQPLQIHWRIDQWFPDLNPEIRAKLKKYHEELLKFNKTVNLIGVKTIPMADAIHFADSILACRAIAKAATIHEIYDFGSGNGFPGLIYALLFPQTKVYLVEIDGRKAEFLKHTISTLGINSAQVLIRAVESLPEKSVKYAMSRGFAPISKAILLARKVVANQGVYFHLKSEEWASEVGQIPTQLCSYWTPSLVADYKLPVGEVRFAVVRTDKIAD